MLLVRTLIIIVFYDDRIVKQPTIGTITYIMRVYWTISITKSYLVFKRKIAI